MLKNEKQVFFCEKQNWEFEPRYLEPTEKQRENYKQCVLKILSYDEFEELVEAIIKDEALIIKNWLWTTT